MNIVVTKSLTFNRPGILDPVTGKPGYAEGSESLTLHARPAAYVVDDWVRESETYKAGRKTGECYEVGEVVTEQVKPPTLVEIMARGRSEEEAQVILLEEQRKFEAGEYPYPAKLKATTPTIDSLMAAGLTRAQAEKALDPTGDAQDGSDSRNNEESDVHEDTGKRGRRTKAAA